MSKAKEVAGWAYKVYTEGQKVPTKEEHMKWFQALPLEEQVNINKANEAFIKQLEYES